MGRCDESPSGELLQAYGEFNRGDWFECHETLEDLWVGEDGETRDFYQGFLQVAVALHHWREGNYGGAVRVLEAGIDYLRRVGPVCQRMDVAGFVSAAERLQEELTALGAERMAALDPARIPKLRIIPSEREGA
jgi:predicted metal-dependent hydrolase